ncbi:MAG: hypothetical protein EOP74_00410 [Variovorax sp.]|nr:MAG: hypothetical protein EOP74_00410 [Variovorax sp.]
MKNTLHKWIAAALAALTLAGCAMVGYGECFSRCGGNASKYWYYGAPADPTRGALWGESLVWKQTKKYAISGFVTLDRIGEPPGASKVDAKAYVPHVTAQKAQGSAWFSVTFGYDYIDPATLQPKEGRIPLIPPPIPPGIYMLTFQASAVSNVFSKQFPFHAPPTSTTIVVEAGKWSVISGEVNVDESTEPMTVTFDVEQSGQDAMPRLRKRDSSIFTPEFVITDPLPASTHSTPSAETVTP